MAKTGNEPVDGEGERRKASPLVGFAYFALGLIVLAAAVTPARADPAEDDARIGFPASTFSPVGNGSANAVAPNETPDGHDDPDGRQRNRRVEIVIPK